MANALLPFSPMSGQGFTRLILNRKNWGVYVTEETKDLGWTRDWYRNPGGNRYKSVQGGNLSYLGADPGPYRNVYEDMSANGDNSYADLIHLCDVINNTPKDDLTDALREIMDVDSTIWQIAGDCIFGNLDSYYTNRNNFYVITDPTHGTMELVNHDLGLSFGTWDGQGSRFDPTYNFDSNLTPLIKNMFRDRRLRKEYFAHIHTLIDEGFRWDKLGAKLDAYRDLIRAEVYRDGKKLFTNADFDNALDKNVQGQFFTIRALKPYIQERETYLKSHPEIDKPRVEFGAVGQDPAFPEPFQAITMRATITGSNAASKMELWWRSQGPFKRVTMYDDGAHDDGARKDGLWAGEIHGLPAASEVEYYLISTTADQKAFTYEPHRRRTRGPSLLGSGGHRPRPDHQRAHGRQPERRGRRDREPRRLDRGLQRRHRESRPQRHVSERRLDRPQGLAVSGGNDPRTRPALDRVGR